LSGTYKLGRRELHFARYADDSNINVKSERAGERTSLKSLFKKSAGIFGGRFEELIHEGKNSP
jgi:hypothetical protein